MLSKQGIPVSPGVAIAKVFVIDAQDVPIPRRTVSADEVEAEVERLHDALQATVASIGDQRDQAKRRLGADLAGVFDFHAQLAQDKYLVEQFERMIREEGVKAEFAVYTVMRQHAKMFGQMEDRLFRERIADIWDVERRILTALMGEMAEKLSELNFEAVLVAHDLTPSQTASLDKEKIKAIVTDAGGRTSHSAIISHALGIPAVVGVEDITTHAVTGDTCIVDGHSGVVLLNPDAERLMEYKGRAKRYAQIESTLDEQAQLPAVTTDGTAITVLANIEFPHEIEPAVAKGAVGIGLYRTEFLFVDTKHDPTEDQQYHVYREAIKALKGKPLTIRTFDLGADKAGLGEIGQFHQTERNPFLGCRSIRLCLQNLPLFTTQLRAILRASVEGPVRIMFPLVSNIMELRQAKMILEDVQEDLDEQDIPYDEQVPLGIMIEVPSAALQAHTLAKEVSFFSIGTNDLIQYTVAVDRSNERIASLYSGAHPAVIRLIREVVKAGNRHELEVGICGEMAGEIDYVMLLVGLGLRTLSVTPPAIPEVKRIIRSVSIPQCERIARRVRALESDREVLSFLRGEVRKVIPEAFE